jgi:hypothetical protein
MKNKKETLDVNNDSNDGSGFNLEFRKLGSEAFENKKPKENLSFFEKVLSFFKKPKLNKKTKAVKYQEKLPKEVIINVKKSTVLSSPVYNNGAGRNKINTL